MFCPDYEGKICYRCYRENWINLSPVIIENCRKPSPGMINFLIQFHAPITDALMVGDRPEDEGAAQAAGIKFMLANEWRNQ
ncbi:HAD hydrolase-like protein [Rippkaea orientalis]|nr:HAD hydrolase-like protein [Rippkaea orientalis]